MDDKSPKKLAGIDEFLKSMNDSRRAMEAIGKAIPKIQNFDFPRVSSPEYKLPEIHIPSPAEKNHYQSASVLMESIAKEAMKWKSDLPESYRPAILAVLYGGIQISVRTLSQVSFHGIRIEGTMNDAPCSVLAHQSTVQLLCYGEEIAPESQHNPIGFVWDTNRIEV